MEEREQGTIPELESPEAASAALIAAESSTQEALSGNLHPEQRAFYNGLLENLQGAKVWLEAKMPRRKFISTAIGITLGVSMLVSYAPNATGPVIASPGEGDNRATVTEFSQQVPSTIERETITQLPIAIKTELTGDFLENLPMVKIEDIKSGLYTQKEQELLKEGKIAPFSSEAIPFPEKSMQYIHFDNGMKIFYLVDDQTRDEYKSDKNKIPYKVSDFSMTEVDGQKILVIGVKYLNKDGSTSFLHYGIQSFNNEKTLKAINRMVDGGDEFYPVTYLKSDKLSYPWFDYGLEPVMSAESKKSVEDNDKLIKRWQDTGNVSNELQNQLLMIYESEIINFFGWTT